MAEQQHPLTNEICSEILPKTPCTSGSILHIAMQAAADWQLERDAEYFAEYLVNIFGLDPEVAQLRAERFKKAMRPQQQEDNND